MNNIFARFLRDEEGATAIEYGLIAALIALAIVSGATLLGESLDTQFQWLGTSLDAARTPGE